MTDDLAPNRVWIPIYRAFDGLRQQYDSAQIYYDDEACWRATNDALLRRLRSGQLSSRSAHYEFHGDVAEPDPRELPKSDFDGKTPIPKFWWSSFQQCEHYKREVDWIAGDFEFEITDKPFENCSGSAYGVEVNQSQIAQFVPTFLTPPESSSPGTASRKGRAPANWWPEFAVELAIYIHEEGVPDGSGHDGQSAVIDRILERLTAAGKSEPGRATVQPVINAVLQRIRSAKN